MNKSWDFCIMKFFEIHFFRVKEIMKSYRKIVPYSFLFPQICVSSIWITKISIFNYALFLCTILYWVKNKQGFFFGLSVMTFQYLLYFPQPLHY